MKIEERKLISISRAIGLFMLFTTLFHRNALDNISFTNSWTDTILQLSANITLYAFPAVGLLLCFTRSLLYFHFAYIVNILSLFGTVYTLLPGKELNLLHLITLLVTHILLMALLIWTHLQIKKIK